MRPCIHEGLVPLSSERSSRCMIMRIDYNREREKREAWASIEHKLKSTNHPAPSTRSRACTNTWSRSRASLSPFSCSCLNSLASRLDSAHSFPLPALSSLPLPPFSLPSLFSSSLFSALFVVCLMFVSLLSPSLLFSLLSPSRVVCARDKHCGGRDRCGSGDVQRQEEEP